MAHSLSEQPSSATGELLKHPRKGMTARCSELSTTAAQKSLRVGQCGMGFMSYRVQSMKH
jgi:hypothetical protein